MSQHPSLKVKGSIGAKRNVLKRFERIKILQKNKKWSKEKQITGLPKQKPIE